MNTRLFRAPLMGALGLSLTLAACAAGTAPVVGTPVSSFADSGSGSLRELLAAASSGDTLTFQTPGTVQLSSPLTLDKNVTIVATGVTFDAGGNARALQVASGAAVTIQGGMLTHGAGQPVVSAAVQSQALSKATWGGLVYNQGTLTLDGVTLTGGSANNGGAIYNTGTLTLRNVTMSGNTATIPTPDLADESTGSGGAIANIGQLTIESGTFSNNTAYYTGGAIRQSGGDAASLLTIKDGLFENNSCTAPNIATVQGGADGCAGGALYLGNNTNILGGTFRGNKATYVGGVMSISKGVKPVVNISGGSFENNSVTGTVNTSGGAILNQSTLNISGGTFKGNSAMLGGVVDVTGGGTLALSGGLMEGNTATQYGGALGIASSAKTFAMTGGTLRGNTAGVGGGAINSNADTTLSAGTIENNTAQDSGGGLNISALTGLKSTVTLSGTLVIQGNKAGAYGGGVNTFSADVGGLTLNLQGAGVTGNAAANSGGGVNIGTRVVVNVSSGSVANNTAVVDGGGVALGGVLTMTGGSVSGNSVSGRDTGQGLGGGVRLYSGSTMTASGGSITNNTGAVGAGVYIGRASATKPVAQFTLAGATVSANKAEVQGGGGFLNDGVLTLQSGSVTGNTSAQSGGGVLNTKVSTFTNTGGSVTGNTPDDVIQQ